jgi:hypothetical protein
MTPSSSTSTTRGRVSMVVDRPRGWVIEPGEAYRRAPADSLPTIGEPDHEDSLRRSGPVADSPGLDASAPPPAIEGLLERWEPPAQADASAYRTSGAPDPVVAMDDGAAGGTEPGHGAGNTSSAFPAGPRSLDAGERDTMPDVDIEAFDAEIEPVDGPISDVSPPPRPVVAVVGLAPRCGASTVARWVAAALAARDPEGAAIISTVAPRGAGALRMPGAARLARGLGARSLEPVRAAGRLCLVDSEVHSPLSIAATYLAPLILDVGHGVPPDAALSVADHVLLVASPEVEPALAEVVAQSIARSAPEPTVVLDRALEDARWDGRADVVLPESRLAARRAASGREARGEIGLAVGELAAALEGSLWH